MRRLSQASTLLLALLAGSVLHADSLVLGIATVPPATNETVLLTVDGSVGQPVGGYSFGVRLPEPLVFVEYVPNPALAGASPFVGIQSQLDAVGTDDFVGIGVLFSTSGIVTRGPGFLELGTLRVAVGGAGLGAGESRVVPIVSGLGSPPVSVEYATTSGPVIPFTLAGGVLGATAPASQLWVVSPADSTITSVDPGGTAGIVVPGAGVLAPRGVAVDPSGLLWAAYSGSDTVRRFDPAGTEVFVFGSAIDRILTGDSPGPVAIARGGSAWIGNQTDATLSVVNPVGRVLFGGDGLLNSPEDGILGPAIPLAVAPSALAADSSGGMWVAAGGPANGFVYRINRSGAIGTVIPYGTAGPVTIAVDREGFAWIGSLVANSVEVRASDGSLVASFVVPAPRALVIRRRPGNADLREAWVVGGTTSAPALFRLRLGSPPDAFSGLGSIDISGLAIDGGGELWAAREDGRVERLDASVAPPTSPLTGVVVDVGTDAEFLGDATGYLQAYVQYPDGNPLTVSFFDFDGDGFTNASELIAASDLFDSQDFPAAIPPVQGLTCTTSGGTVTAIWSIAPDVDPVEIGPQGYDAIEVRIDGVPSMLQPAATDTQIVLPVSRGVRVIEVIGIAGATSSAPSSCAVAVGPGQLIASAEVVDATGDLANPFGIAAVLPPPTDPALAALYIADPGARQILVLNTEETVIASFSSDVFGGAFGATSCAYVEPPVPGAAASLYVIGGVPNQPMRIRRFSVDPLGNALLGALDLVPLENSVAIMGEPGGMSAAWADPSGMDEIIFFSAVQPQGCVIFSVLASTPTGEVADSFLHPEIGSTPFGLNGVALVGGPGAFTTPVRRVWLTAPSPIGIGFEMIEVEVTPSGPVPTGASVPFIVLASENSLGDFAIVPDIVQQELVIRVVGIAGSTVNEIDADPSSTFVQYVNGDANADGNLNIADAVLLLGILFTGATQLQCDAALDANDDGTINVADPIFVLGYLFSGGAAPAAPFPLPGGLPFDCVLP